MSNGLYAPLECNDKQTAVFTHTSLFIFNSVRMQLIFAERAHLKKNSQFTFICKTRVCSAAHPNERTTLDAAKIGDTASESVITIIMNGC